MICLSSFSPTLKHSTINISRVDRSSDLTIDLEIPPTFSNCPPADISATYTAGTCGAVVTWTPPTASPDAVSVTSNYSPGDSFLPGTTAVIYRAQNAGGQVSTCSFNVTVTDDEVPVFDTFPTDITLTADPNTCTASHSWLEPTASDNCPAGSGYAPVLQDFESTINQCYTFSRSTIGNGGEINGTRNLVANSLSSISSLTSSITTPVFYFNGYGEITFSHKISSLLNSPAIHLDILDSSGNVVTSNFFTESYTTTGVQQEIIPLNLTGNYQLKIRFTSSMAFGAGLTAYLDNLLIPGTIVTNINDTSCSLADYIIFRSDGTGLNSGNQFDV
ncbi:MAG: HYR domain-containing protein, partial [Flavobacteriales bacterium]